MTPAPRKLRSEAEVTRECLDALRLFGLEPRRRNVGAAVMPSGRRVRFNEPGEADWEISLPDGRTLYLEIKREGFDPKKARGREKERFARQLARLRGADARGQVGLWVDNAPCLIRVLKVVLDGGRVVEEADGSLAVYPKGG